MPIGDEADKLLDGLHAKESEIAKLLARYLNLCGDVRLALSLLGPADNAQNVATVGRAVEVLGRALSSHNGASHD